VVLDGLLPVPGDIVGVFQKLAAMESCRASASLTSLLAKSKP
jgi:hypothetical protein